MNQRTIETPNNDSAKAEIYDRMVALGYNPSGFHFAAYKTALSMCLKQGSLDDLDLIIQKAVTIDAVTTQDAGAEDVLTRMEHLLEAAKALGGALSSLIGTLDKVNETADRLLALRSQVGTPSPKNPDISEPVPSHLRHFQGDEMNPVTAPDGQFFAAVCKGKDPMFYYPRHSSEYASIPLEYRNTVKYVFAPTLAELKKKWRKCVEHKCGRAALILVSSDK